MSRDYAAEAGTDPQVGDLIKGSRLLCALDERTCLTCLEHDGREPPRPLPIHEGCRCVTLPVLKTFAELGVPLREVPGGTRSSAIGQVPGDGGLYKRYLLCRARGVASGLAGNLLAHHLKQWLSTETSGVAAEPDVAAAVRAALLAYNTDVPNDEILQILDAIPWTARNLAAVFEVCSTHGLYDAIEACVRRLIMDVPDGYYAGRHRASLCRTAASSMRKVAPARALTHLVRAAELDPANTAIHVELAKALRQQRDFPGARRYIELALAVNPAHKGALAQLEQLSKSTK